LPIYGGFLTTTFVVHDSMVGILDVGGGSSSSDNFEPAFLRSTDSGASWTGTPLPTLDLFVSPRVIASDHFDGNRIYVWCDAVASPDYLCRSTNGGLDFEVIQDGFLATDAFVDPTDANRVFAIRKDTPGDVQLSTDGGLVWESRSAGLPSAQSSALLEDPSDPDHFAAVYRTAGVYVTEDGGLSWAPAPLPGYTSQAIIDADWDPSTDRFFLLTTEDGAYVSGVGFVSIDLATSSTNSICYEPLSQSALVGTEYASVLRLDIGSAVSTSSIAHSPADLTIRAHPNPSDRGFRFELHLSRTAEHAGLAIFDISGRRVAAPFSGTLSEGAHILEWTGQMSSGLRASPGIYFARLEASGRVATTRITLIE
jgi:hypothetical protein